MTAVLLVKGVSDCLIDRQDFREVTRTIWSELFFGEGATRAHIPARIASFEEPAEQEAFKAALASPRLSAALALWTMTEWAADDPEGLAFRFSAAQLHLEFPWLFAGGSEEEISTEIRNQAEVLLPRNEQVIVSKVWADVVRSGEALRLLAKALENRPVSRWRKSVEREWLEPSDVVWVNNAFALPIRRVPYRDDNNIELRIIGERGTRKYKGRYIISVHDLLSLDSLNMRPEAIHQVMKLVNSVELTHI